MASWESNSPKTQLISLASKSCELLTRTKSCSLQELTGTMHTLDSGPWWGASGASRATSCYTSLEAAVSKASKMSFGATKAPSASTGTRQPHWWLEFVLTTPCVAMTTSIWKIRTHEQEAHGDGSGGRQLLLAALKPRTVRNSCWCSWTHQCALLAVVPAWSTGVLSNFEDSCIWTRMQQKASTTESPQCHAAGAPKQCSIRLRHLWPDRLPSTAHAPDVVAHVGSLNLGGLVSRLPAGFSLYGQSGSFAWALLPFGTPKTKSSSSAEALSQYTALALQNGRETPLGIYIWAFIYYSNFHYKLIRIILILISI